MSSPANPEFIHRFAPGSSTPPARTLLLLHGTGGDETDLLSLGAMLLPGAALLSPRGRVLEAGMPRFFRRIREGVFDIPDLKARALELGVFVDWARKNYRLEGSRLGALGFSNGANIGSALALLRPDLLRDLVLLRPMVPFVPDSPPDLGRLAVLVARGTRDPTVPPGQTEQLADMFRRAGATVTLQESAAGHGLVPDDYAAVQTFFSTASNP